MSEGDTPRLGERVIDSVTESEVVVVGYADETAGEYPFTYDHNKQPVTVSEHENNAEFPASDAVVFVVYRDALDEAISGWQGLESETLVQRVETENLKQYSHPASRLQNRS
jgi:hypothetical protein